MAPRKYTALAGTHSHMGGVKQLWVIFLPKEITDRLCRGSNPEPFGPEASVLPLDYLLPDADAPIMTPVALHLALVATHLEGWVVTDCFGTFDRFMIW